MIKLLIFILKHWTKTGLVCSCLLNFKQVVSATTATRRQEFGSQSFSWIWTINLNK